MTVRFYSLGLVGAILIGVFCSFVSCKPNEVSEMFTDEPTVKSLAFSNVRSSNRLYLKEDGEYIPYLVFDYYQPNSVLLLRENILSQKFQYATAAIFGTGVSYYANSIIDNYLNQDFINSLSESVQDQIALTDLIITSEDTVLRGDARRNTETIKRKIFLLSATEYGQRSNMLTKEGKKISGLENFITSDLDREWLRSSSLWDDVHAWALSDEVIGTENVTSFYGIRPAFVVKSDLVIEKRSDIISGSEVYSLAIEI